MYAQLWTHNPATNDVAVITQLLHQAHCGLTSQGIDCLASYQDEARTLQRLTAGESFVVRDGDGLILATITLRDEARDCPECLYYQRPGVFIFEQFAVRKDRQGTGIGRQLMETIEQRAIERGAVELACDTAESAGDLITMYQRHGYKIVERVDWDVTDYISVVLSKPLQAEACT